MTREPGAGNQVPTERVARWQMSEPGRSPGQLDDERATAAPEVAPPPVEEVETLLEEIEEAISQVRDSSVD